MKKNNDNGTADTNDRNKLQGSPSSSPKGIEGARKLTLEPKRKAGEVPSDELRIKGSGSQRGKKENKPKEVEINAVEEGRYEKKWVKYEATIDSGAADTVTPKRSFPGVRTEPSEGSRRGMKFITAGGQRVDNEGQKRINFITKDGRNRSLKSQVANINKTLIAVGKVCDAGHKVHFTKHGGWIENEATGDCTEFKRSRGVYVMDMWVEENSDDNTGSEQQSSVDRENNILAKLTQVFMGQGNSRRNNRHL